MVDYLNILLGDTTKDALDTYKCSKCASKEIKIWEHQTRSSDEPITIFKRCLSCGYTELED